MLLDTNVWLDFFLDRSNKHDLAGQLVTRAVQNDVTLFTSIQSIKDVHFLIGLELKREQRDATGKLDEAFARAIDEVAWACISSIRKQSIIVPADESDMLEAMLMRDKHTDFEDNLIAAAAMRCNADYLVTSDRQMLGHQVVTTASIEEALAVIGDIAHP